MIQVCDRHTDSVTGNHNSFKWSKTVMQSPLRGGIALLLAGLQLPYAHTFLI